MAEKENTNNVLNSMEIKNLRDKADSHLEQEEFIQALKYYDIILTKCTEQLNFEDWYKKGICHLNLDQFEDALNCNTHVIENNPSDFRALTNKAISLFNLNKAQEAIDLLRKALSINPNIGPAWYNLGEYFNNCSNKDVETHNLAVNAFRRAVKCNPTFNKKMIYHSIERGICTLGTYLNLQKHVEELTLVQILPPKLTDDEKEKEFARYCEILKNKDIELQGEAAYKLGKIGDKRAIPALIEVLRKTDLNEEVFSYSVVALGRIGDRRALPMLFELFTMDYAYDYEAFDELTAAINKICDKRDVPKLIKSLKYGVENRVLGIYNLIIALGRLGATKAISTLFDVLNNDFPDWIHDGAIDALIEIGEPAVPYLIKELGEMMDVPLRPWAIEALGNIGDERAIPILEQALQSKLDFIRAYAEEALERIENPELRNPERFYGCHM